MTYNFADLNSKPLKIWNKMYAEYELQILISLEKQQFNFQPTFFCMN